MLASIGGLAGLLVASWAVALLASAVTTLPRAQNVAMNWPVVLFALGLSMVTGLIFGVAPAVQAARQPIRESLNEESRGASGSTRQRKTRSTLVVGEIALALVLLVVAGLLLRSFSALTRVDPGFNPEHLLIVNLPLAPQKYRDDVRRTTTIQQAIDRVRSLPGVEKAGITTGLPMSGGGATIMFNRAAHPPAGPDEYVAAGYRAVTPEYFATLGVPLRRGRLLGESDRHGSSPVVVINESMARQYFPGRDPLGERIQLGTEPDPAFPFMEIVGVVGDVKQSFETGSSAEMFVPYAQYPLPILTGMYLMRGLLFRVDTLDPLTFISAPVVLAAAALLASYVPARRAAKISPLTALAR